MDRLTRAKMYCFLSEFSKLMREYGIDVELYEHHIHDWDKEIHLEDQYGDGINLGGCFDANDIQEILDGDRIPEWEGHLATEDEALQR